MCTEVREVVGCGDDASGSVARAEAHVDLVDNSLVGIVESVLASARDFDVSLM